MRRLGQTSLEVSHPRGRVCPCRRPPSRAVSECRQPVSAVWLPAAGSSWSVASPRPSCAQKLLSALCVLCVHRLRQLHSKTHQGIYRCLHNGLLTYTQCSCLLGEGKFVRGDHLCAVVGGGLLAVACTALIGERGAAALRTKSMPSCNDVSNLGEQLRFLGGNGCVSV